MTTISRGQRLDLVEHVARHDDRLAGLAELLDPLDDVDARHRIDAGQRLVEQQEVGIVRDRGRELGALAHALARSP